MAYTTIDDPSEYFQTALWSGSGSGQAITNGGNSDLQPDWAWIKKRAGGTARSHQLYDSTRGVTKLLHSDATDAEQTQSQGLTAFGSDGFTVGTDDGVNGSGGTYVAWQWKANGGTATATGSESGNNPAYSTQANQTAGFSIITYTGTGANSSSVVPHGLGVTPQVMIVKRRDGTSNWVFESSQTHNARGMYLNLTDGSASSGTDVVNKDSTNLSFVEIDNNRRVNHDGETFVAYCFAPIQGYSKFGSYTGNGNADGPFMYTGFKPALVIIKGTTGSKNWFMYDTTRNPFNLVVNRLIANGSEAENTGSGDDIDILSNGWKIRANPAALNENGEPFIYMAFAESPFVSSEGVPTTAR